MPVPNIFNDKFNDNSLRIVLANIIACGNPSNIPTDSYFYVTNKSELNLDYTHIMSLFRAHAVIDHDHTDLELFKNSLLEYNMRWLQAVKSTIVQKNKLDDLNRLAIATIETQIQEQQLIVDTEQRLLDSYNNELNERKRLIKD